jgi:PAS domain S-box-containing protein
MRKWHKLLERQLRKHWYGKYLSPEMAVLLQSIDESYRHYDRDHLLIERAMELSSQELMAVNQKLREELRYKQLAEEAIHAKDRILQTINDNLSEAIYRSHVEGGVVYVNQAFVDLFGYDSEEEALRTPSEKFYANAVDREKLNEKFDSNNSLKREEILFRRKDGSFFWGLMSTVMSKDNSGTLYYDGAIIDISNQKRNEENLRAANALLEKTNAELDRFVYSASHDLRAPLRSLLGLIQLFEMEKTQDPNHYLEKMRSSIFKLDHFIQDIIDYSRNSRLETVSEQIDFPALIEDSFDQFKFLPLANKIRRKLNLDTAFPFYSDRKRLQIVLNNLISNAINYANPFERDPYIKIEVVTDSRFSDFKVIDNGLGIDDVHIEKIFDMFYRGSTNSTGSGLGLYIVKETLDKLKGEIKVTSKKNMGSTFAIRIPNSKLLA